MKLYLVAFATALLVAPGAALAYVGPGAGISAIGSLLALIAAILLAIVGFLWFPLKRMLRKRAAEKPEIAKADPKVDE